MRLVAEAVALGDGAGAEVPAVDLIAEPGAPVVVAVETDERPQLLTLLLGGRVKPTSGRVTIDGADDPAALRRRVAVVDTPFASEPGSGLRVSTAVAEELAFAGRPAGRGAVAELLAGYGLAEHAGVRFGTLAAADRIRLLTELALLRPGVEAIVLTSPERHGGDPGAWFPRLAGLAADGLVVVVVTDLPTAAALRAEMKRADR